MLERLKSPAAWSVTSQEAKNPNDLQITFGDVTDLT